MLVSNVFYRQFMRNFTAYIPFDDWSVPTASQRFSQSAKCVTMYAVDCDNMPKAATAHCSSDNMPGANNLYAIDHC